MMRQYELVERVRRYNPQTDETLLNRAYVYAMKAHGSQKRASGDPYFSHPLEVSAILTDMKLDDATIVAALLHDTIEDTAATRDEIDSLFGKEIGALVEGLTKIKRLDLVSREAKQAENLRKLLLAIADDIRVLLVKLADRLHNMRTLHYVPAAKRNRVAQETLDIYAPLAERMGMQAMREELENLAFAQLSPDVHSTICNRLEGLRDRHVKAIAEIETLLVKKLEENGITAEVSGREKRPYSIWRKMERKTVGFEQLSDLIGFRVIVDTIEECYHTLGIVHTTWPVVPGRFKDYISTPKQNDYRSIHTTVVGPSRQRVELQIRTQDMQDVAEYGIAAHALYKDGVHPDELLSHDSQAYSWLRRTIELLAEGDNPEEFLEHTKLELFHDQVFCFTPKGRLIALPRQATPIDFAYAVHTDVGDTAVGCKIDGNIAPLISELQNGAEVEIITAPGATPPAAWETIAVTAKARAAIRRATRAAMRAQYAGLGRKLVERSFERAKKPFDEARITAALHRVARSSMEEALSAVGRGELRPTDLVKAVFPDWKEEMPAPQQQRRRMVAPEAGWFGLARAASLKFKIPGFGGSTPQGPAIPIRGINSDLPVRFAPDGGAVPGDRIVGILTPGEGITIFPIQAPALKEYDDQPERWLDVRWDIDGDNTQRFPARLVLTSINEPGTLARIAQIVGDKDANIDNVRLSRKAPDFTEMTIDVEVFDIKHLNAIIAELRNAPVVSSVDRYNG